MLKKIYSKDKNDKEVLRIEYDSFKDLMINIIPGSKIKFGREKRRYTCIARSDNFIIFTKPYNLQKDVVQYTIFDLTQMKCNRDNLVFGIYDYSKVEDCEEALLALENSLLEENDRKEIQFESINLETREPYIHKDKPTLEISRRGICNIEDKVDEIWVEVKRGF